MLFFYLLVSNALVINDTLGREISGGIDMLDEEDWTEFRVGSAVSIIDLPFVAAIHNALNKEVVCAGVIVSEKRVLTAGYCITEPNKKKIVKSIYISIVAGIVDMRDVEQAQWRFAKAVMKGPQNFQFISQLVLIEVTNPFSFNYRVKPSHFPDGDFSGSNSCLICGWAPDDSFNSDRIKMRSLILKTLYVTALNKDLCQRGLSGEKTRHMIFQIEHFICVEEIKDTNRARPPYCAGNNGALLICKDPGGEPIPVGIATSEKGGTLCNRSDIPTSFYDLGAFKWWISNL